jgi:hypothetical protein
MKLATITYALFKNRWRNAWAAFLLMAGLYACQTQQDKHDQELTGTTAIPPVKVSTFASGKGWGYEVKVGSRRFIYQPVIPAVGNHRPFGSEEKARKTGELVAYKIKHNLLPPALSVGELDSLGVLE